MRRSTASQSIIAMRLSLLLLCAVLPAVTLAYPSFDEFVQQYRKTYDTKNEEHQRRAIYESNLEMIVMHNTMYPNKHTLAINHLMDLMEDEVPKGYDKSMMHGGRDGSSASSATSSNHKQDAAAQQQQRQAERRGLSHHHSDSSDDEETPPTINIIHDLPFAIDSVDALPDSIDWRAVGAATPVKDQGRCGSCWAFASIAALESHLFLETGLLYSLSIQELISCASNPKQCGGNGGCTGATAVQAYDAIAKLGIVQEWAFGYASYHGDNDIPCDLPLAPHYGHREPSKLVKDAVATIDGYVTLPTNNYTVMMNAVAKVGPLVISVAASGWQFYRRGVFSRPFQESNDANIDHAVVLMGYGTDSETGQDYWLVRNSWAPTWGEEGYIRLLRQDPATMNDDADCAMDVTPGDGDACQYDDNGDKIDPLPARKVCGTSGVYTEGYFPVGTKLV